MLFLDTIPHVYFSWKLLFHKVDILIDISPTTLKKYLHI